MHTKPFIRTGLSVGTVALSLCVMMTPAPARAGFKWVPPEEASQVISSAPVASAPATRSTSSAMPEFTPQVIEAPARAPSTPSLADVTTTIEAPATTVAAPVIEPVEPAASPSLAAPVPSFSIADDQEKPVLGFANNVPLSVALRQVLPAEYSFSVAQDVSLGTIVSWRGGSSWRHVLKAMLLPAGLSSKEDGSTVQVVPAMTASSSSSSAPVSGQVLTAPAGAQIAAPVIEGEILAPPASALAAPEHTLPVLQGEEPKLQAIDAPLKLQAPAASPVSSLSLDSGKPVPLLSPASAKGMAAPKEISAPATMGYLVPPTKAAPAAPELTAAPLSLGTASPVHGDTFDMWAAEKGQTLHEVLEKWCRRAQVELTWQSEYDYPLQANVSLNGSFEDAVRALLFGFEGARPQPIGQLHKNADAGQMVLIVQARGNEYNE